MKYKYIFFDLDDTLWAFSINAKQTLTEVYEALNFSLYFNSYKHFYSLYKEVNSKVWDLYGKGAITKEELISVRSSFPFEQVGVKDEQLIRKFSDTYYALMKEKELLEPYAKEILTYLHAQYKLAILSNGFKELQYLKLERPGIAHFFDQVILSDHIGVMKPSPELFHYALKKMGATAENSIMVGDNIDTDIRGAHRVGMDQIYYNPRSYETSFKSTYEINHLSQIEGLL